MRSTEPGPLSRIDSRAVAEARFRASMEVPTAFFADNADGIARACRDLARAFAAGGRLLVAGEEAQWSDALHVSVEFVHPVIVGKRALPALALHGNVEAHLRALAEPGDVLLVLTVDDSASVLPLLALAQGMGIRTIALLGANGGGVSADHVFAVPCDDPFVVQEVHETLYHVLWELVHVFLEHPGTLR